MVNVVLSGGSKQGERLMLQHILNDFGTAMSMVFDFNNLVGLVAIFVIALITGLRMGSYGNIFGAIMESVLLLALFNYLWNWLSEPGRFSITVWEGETIQSWNDLMSVTGMILIGYFAVFFLLITAVYLVKSIANR